MEKKKMQGHMAMLVANIIFGVNNPISRSLMPEVLSPYTLTFFRFSGGMLIFWIASMFVKNEKIERKDLLKLFFASTFALTINQLAFFVGLSMTSPIDASIVVTMLPIVTMILAAIIIKEPITLMKAVGVLVGASGALIIIFSNHNGHGGEGNFLGNVIVFCAVVSFAFYLTLFKELISKYSAITLMKWMFLFATIVSLPFCLNHALTENYSNLSWDVYLRIGFVVIFATFLGYLLIPIGQKVLRPTTFSMYNYVQPVMASIVAVFAGLAAFGYTQALAGVLVFSGVYIVTQSKSKAQLDAEKAGKAPKAMPPTGE